MPSAVINAAVPMDIDTSRQALMSTESPHDGRKGQRTAPAASPHSRGENGASSSIDVVKNGSAQVRGGPQRS